MKNTTRQNCVRRTLSAVTVAAAIGAMIVGGMTSPAAAAIADLVTLPNAPGYTPTRCPDGSTNVSTPTQLNSAYTNVEISCITLIADITFATTAPFVGSTAVLDRSLNIEGNGHSLTFPVATAYGNRPFFLRNQTGTATKTLALRNMNIRYDYGSWLVSGELDQAAGWNVVFDGLNLKGIQGIGSGSPNGRPLTGYLANLFLEGHGESTNTYGRLFPRNVIIANGAQWKLAAAAAASHEPQLDLTYGLAFGPKGESGKVWVLGELTVNGGFYSAIYSFAGIYVSSSGRLTATSEYNGYSFGALTTAGGTNGTGEIWIDDDGELNAVNPNGIALYAVYGAPLDLRADRGSIVRLTGRSTESWLPGLGLGTVTMATGGSSIQFNSPAELNIVNIGNNPKNNWAISSLYNNGTAFDYSLSIYGSRQTAVWNHDSAVADSPDRVWNQTTIRTNASGTALPGSGPSTLVSEWNTTSYRRIFSAETEQFDVPTIDPVIAISALGLAVIIAPLAVLARHRRRRRMG